MCLCVRYVCVCLCTCMHVCVHVCVSVCACACLCVCACVRACVRACVCVCFRVSHLQDALLLALGRLLSGQDGEAVPAHLVHLVVVVLQSHLVV
jgi:hypothetical protein